LQLLSNADIKGDSAGSMELLFSPGEVKGGDIFFDIGTAGATSLVLQTIIPSLLFLKEKTVVTLKGGTHVPFSPCFHFLAEVFAQFLKRIGVTMQLAIESYGFYPRGGGKIRAVIFPVEKINPLTAVEKGKLLRLKIFSGAGNLPPSIAERQKNALLEKIHSQTKSVHCPVETEMLNVPTPGQGTFAFLKSEFENSVAGFTSLGERGKRAEAVGEEAAAEFLGYYSADASLDPHIADQIVLYLSLCKEESVFTTSRITDHLSTNLWAVGLFHGYRYSVEGEKDHPGRVVINPRNAVH
jgi:RNA 3'-terminal phosphate cyclase (ATP)